MRLLRMMIALAETVLAILLVLFVQHRQRHVMFGVDHDLAAAAAAQMRPEILHRTAGHEFVGQVGHARMRTVCVEIKGDTLFSM